MHTRVPFDKLEKELYELSEILKQFEIATSKKSSLESIILESTKLRDQYEANSAIDLHFDIRPVYRNLLGIHDFVDKFLKVKNHPGFQALKPHVALLETSLAAGQNIKAPVTDGDANKLFEYCSTIQELPQESRVKHCIQKIRRAYWIILQRDYNKLKYHLLV